MVDNNILDMLDNLNIFRVRVYLRGKERNRFNRYTGFAIRSLCYNIFREVEAYDPSIHDINIPKPFSVTPLMEKDGDIVKARFFEVGKEPYFDIILNIDIVPIKLFRDFFSEGREIRLDENEFIVVGVEILNTQFNKLYKFDGDIPEKFVLDFYTPTSFRYEIVHTYFSETANTFTFITNKSRYTVQHLYPEPKYLIRSILKTLRDIYSIKLEEEDIFEILEYIINGNLLISRINNMKTIPLRNPPYRGFTGIFEYMFRDISKYGEVANTIYRLIRFGEIFGVGMGRTMGMGRYKVLTNP